MEEGSRRTVTGERPINAERDGAAMGVDSVSGEKQKTGHSHSGHWGTFRAGICLEYVSTRLEIPTLIQQGKSLYYQLYIMKFL